MLHRIRLAMQTETFDLIDGEIEGDETFIGGKARFMHKADRERRSRGPAGWARFLSWVYSTDTAPRMESQHRSD